jgi:RimJ/RimL family protein N-acetyltransferase
MTHPLVDVLQSNQGNILTPELIWGILRSYDLSVPESIYAGVTGVVPSEPAPHEDPRLVTADRERVGEWVAAQVGQKVSWGGFTAIGLLDKPGGELVAGTVLNNITETNAAAHVAFSGRHSLKRVLITAFFDYAFNQLDLERLTGFVDADNAQALRFDRHLGFEDEFIIPRGNGGDVVQLVMWREKCRWLERGK